MKKYIFIGSLVFLLAMLIYIPASIASKLLPNNISANQFQGNIWNGSATSLKINKVNVGLVTWEIKPSCLLILKVCANIKQNSPDVTSSFLLKIRGNTELHNLIANGNAHALNPLVSNYGVSLSGGFEADLSQISFGDENIQYIEGELKASSLLVNGVLRLALGNLNSVFLPESDRTDIQISNSDGHLDVTGIVQLFNDMSYDLDLSLRKNSKSTDAIINGMQFAGEIQADGSVRLQQNGKLAI